MTKMNSVRSIMFWVPGRPASKARPRVAVSVHRGRRIDSRVYTPEATKRSEDAFRAAAIAARLEHKIEKPISGSIYLNVWFVFTDKRAPGGGEKTGRPDIDNLLKLVLDGINGSGLWYDDAQVVRVVASKYVATIDKEQGTMVQVQEVSQ